MTKRESKKQLSPLGDPRWLAVVAEYKRLSPRIGSTFRAAAGPAADYRHPFMGVVMRVGLDAATVTFYSLGHTSIVRALLAGVAGHLCTVSHDTSIAMTEKSYSAFISDHSGSLLRRALFDVAQPAAGNVVTLPGW